MSGRIPKSFITSLIERTDIVDIISDRIDLKKKGANYTACCPFHNEKTPSFSVSQPKQFYHCFGCGVSGDAISFLMEFERLSFVEAIEQLAKSVGLTVPYEAGSKPKELQVKSSVFELMEKIAAYYQKQLQQSELAKNYLNSRQLSGEIIKKYQLGFSLDAWQQVEKVCGFNREAQDLLIKAGMLIEGKNRPYDRFRNRIMFPIRNRQGQIIGFGGRSLGDENPKYLNSPETPLFHKGKELYGLFEAQKDIRDAKKIIVVEGYMDTIALAQFDIGNVVATLGTAATEDHIKLLMRYSEEIIFCFDGDKAGRQAAWRAMENALAHVHTGVKISFCFLPEGEDPDTYLRQHGKDSFLELINSALNLTSFLIKQISANIDLNSIDGKNRFCQKVKPLLLKIAPGVYQQLLLKQFSQIIRLDEESFANLVGISLPTKSPTKSRPSRYTSKISSSTSPMQQAIALLIQHPELAKQLDDLTLFAECSTPGIELLLSLIEVIQANKASSTASLLQHFSEHPQISALKKLATRELFYDENGLIQEFIDILQTIERTNQEQKIDDLLSKASISGLSQEERQLLQHLISEKHNS